MRTLPARRLAYSALCAVLLVGITGPAALAADSAPERRPLATLLDTTWTADVHASELAPVRDLLSAILEAKGESLSAARIKELGDAAKAALAGAAADGTPVTDEDPATASTGATTTAADTTTATGTVPSSGTTPTAAATIAPATTTPAASAPVTPAPVVTAPAASTSVPTVALPAEAATFLSDLPGAVREAVDSILNLLLPRAESGTAQAPSVTDSLMTGVDDLLTALLGPAPQVSTLPAPAGPVPAAPAS